MKKYFKFLLRSGRFLAVLLTLSLTLQTQYARAADAAPKSVKMSQGSLTLRLGRSKTLSVTFSPKSAGKADITWSSSNQSVAAVSKSGKVTAKKTGNAVITAKTENGKKATCKVKVTSDARQYTVSTKNGKMTYQMYNRMKYGGYYANYGCVTTVVAIAASGYGKYYTPAEIHTGAADKSYSERYAVKKMGASASLYGRAAISLLTASQILTDMGIENKAVCKFTASAAIKEIKAHVKEGKPVILKANNKRHNGVRIAVGHHAMVLVGIDAKGYGIFLSPDYGRVNYAHASNNYFKMSIDTFVKYHMTSASGNYKTPYVTSTGAAGGYILVG